MSLKFKIPLLMLTALALNVFILLGYFWFSLSGRVEEYQSNMNHSVFEAARDISDSIDGKDIEYAKAYLSSYDNPKGLSFTLTDTLSGQEWTPGAIPSRNIGFSRVTVVSLGDREYVLHVQKYVELLNLRTHGVFRDLLLFEIYMLIGIFILVGAVIHLRYVSALLRLDEDMRRYRAGGTVRIENARRDEIGKLQNSFYKLSGELEEEKSTQKRIIASISHDIKTPLTSVLGYSERLLKKELDVSRQRQYIGTIYSQARDIETIVDEFDDYLSAAVQKREQLQPYKVSYICAMVQDEYVSQLREKGIIFTVGNSCGQDTSVLADLPKLRRVFANIIANSVRHSTADSLKITFSASVQQGKVVLTITDNGQGVSESDLTHIFEPFYTSDKSRRVSGLGLSICKQIIDGHGGNISARNGESGGFIVFIALPVMGDSR